MKIGLIDVDGHNFPNLPLMKISAYHKAKGDDISFGKCVQRCDKKGRRYIDDIRGDYIIAQHYEKVYISKIFTEQYSADINFYPSADEIIYGGSGYDLKNKLPYEIEHQYPDYTIYPQYKFALGFLTRGCPRINHPFCITPKKDGCKSLKVADLSEFWRGQKEIILLDQNLLACKDHMDLLQQLIDSKANVSFDGGIDARLTNDKNLELLAKVRVDMHHFAWDDPREDLKEKFRQIREALPQDDRSKSVYVLTNFWSTHEEDLDRIYWLRDNGFTPYVMIYDKAKAQRQTKDLQRWVNNRRIFRTVKNFNEYKREMG